MSTHPQWCRRDHACTAGRLTSGEHRSTPVTVTAAGTGGAVVTVVQRPARRAVAELRLWVPLDAPGAAGQVAEVEALTRALAAALSRVARSRRRPGSRE